MVPARRLGQLGRTATIGAGRGGLLLESENPSTASPIKQLPVNEIPTDWLSQNDPTLNPPANSITQPVQTFLTDTPIDLSTPVQPAPPLDVKTTPPQYLLATPSSGRLPQKPTRASGVESPVTVQPIDDSNFPATGPPAAVIYPAAPPQKGTIPAPVNVLPSPPQTLTITQPAPGAVTSTGAPSPATVTTAPTGLIPQTVTQPGMVNLFGYQIPTSYVLIGGALLVLWLMDTHKSGGRR